MAPNQQTLDFLKLFVRHQQEIYAYILTLVPNVHDADDVFQDGMVVASVEDDGSGFDVNEVQSSTQQRKGLGLPTIEERAEMLGGNLHIEGRIGRGTKVRIEIPTTTQ